ncbi:hypothetical protein [Romboutsia sp.]|uniref:hypothetical protein n=1 Tax=Romboutsia sp. TaxID=1965302 RepID=UPI002CF271F5|nr:hypothetical protein [Romboutsia sp.]HSQ89369.1 hypothetical protein [Romboutsia sp.]
MKKELYEFTYENGDKTNILFTDYGTHIGVGDIGDNDIDYIFGKAILVTNKPSTIEKELKYIIDNLYRYAPKVVEYKLLESK